MGLICFLRKFIGSVTCSLMWSFCSSQASNINIYCIYAAQHFCTQYEVLHRDALFSCEVVLWQKLRLIGFFSNLVLFPNRQMYSIYYHFGHTAMHWTLFTGRKPFYINYKVSHSQFWYYLGCMQSDFFNNCYCTLQIIVFLASV